MSRGGGHKGSGPAHFVDGVYHGGGILSHEFRGDTCILPVLNECREEVVIEGSGTARSEVSPLPEDNVWIYDDRLPPMG